MMAFSTGGSFSISDNEGFESSVWWRIININISSPNLFKELVGLRVPGTLLFWGGGPMCHYLLKCVAIRCFCSLGKALQVFLWHHLVES